MSTVLSLQGIHGGTGVTTVLAALGQGLHAQGQRVLLVEYSPDQMLGLHLGLPADVDNGWGARSWTARTGVMPPTPLQQDLRCCLWSRR